MMDVLYNVLACDLAVSMNEQQVVDFSNQKTKIVLMFLKS